MRQPTSALFLVFLGTLAAGAVQACPLARGEPAARIVAVERGAVRLADGMRLVPPGAVMPTQLDPSPARAKAAEEASRPLENRALRLAPVPTDRYGRLPASATFEDEAGPVDLAVALVAAGAAYADPARRPACAEALLSAERDARAARRGLWAVADTILPAGDVDATRERVGLFSVAEGRVYRARRAGGTLYVNFTSPRKASLVATTTGKSANGLDTAILTGNLVRVRGMVDEGGRLAFEAGGLESADAATGIVSAAGRKGTKW